MFDPGNQTNPEFKRRVFVGIGAGAAAIGTTMAAALAQTPPPAVAEDDPSIRTRWVKLPTGISAYAATPNNTTAQTPGIVMVQHIWGVDATIRDDVHMTPRRFSTVPSKGNRSTSSRSPFAETMARATPESRRTTCARSSQHSSSRTICGSTTKPDTRFSTIRGRATWHRQLPTPGRARWRFSVSI
jgi:hypothetical protein